MGITSRDLRTLNVRTTEARPAGPVTVVLPYPPTDNHLFATVRGRRVLSREGRQYKVIAAAEAVRQGMRPMDGDVIVHVDLYRPMRAGEPQNRGKALLDSLNGVAYVDDRQIKRVTLERHDTDKANPRAVVTVTAINN